ncbi:MAG TPA: deoxyribose-phosphate aldolase [Beijerinckiaceae bacterium]|jgi:deoxyribose-phosphate aldolase
MSERDLALRALRLLDLTDLTETCSDRGTDALCAKALDPRGPVAAVCLWPQFVSRARDALRDSPVRIATVVNFPQGTDDIDRVLDDIGEALGDGAQEIDLVLPYAAFLAGDVAAAADMVLAVRDVVDQGRTLKVILETGALETHERIAAASRLAIEGGADFIKTSTGKIPVSATLPAARTMLDAIKTAGRPVGLKPSGGIRTLADAAGYLALADEVMGPAWATPKTFRFGASGLYDALIAAIDGREPGSTTVGVY